MKVTKEKTGLVLIVATILTNPLTGQYVLTGLDMLFQLFFVYGSWVSLAASVYIVGLILWYMYQSREVVNIPSKKHKTQKTGKYITT